MKFVLPIIVLSVSLLTISFSTASLRNKMAKEPIKNPVNAINKDTFLSCRSISNAAIIPEKKALIEYDATRVLN